MKLILGGVFVLALSLGRPLPGYSGGESIPAAQAGVVARQDYILGPEDQITIRVLNADEINDKPIEIPAGGYINVPLAGQVRASGLSARQLARELAGRLKTYMRDPQVSVEVVGFRSQPVSVLGAVTTPGVQQLKGRRTLAEILSMAGGPRADAGNKIKIMRRKEWGKLPIPGAVEDSSGQFSMAEVSLKAATDGLNPQMNILIQPFDIITVSKAEMVYVVGEVTKPGGYVLNEKESLSVLEALSMAGGTRLNAAGKYAKILRSSKEGTKRVEIPVNLVKLVSGKEEDLAMRPDDILVVPNNATKNAALRIAEAAIQIGTGVAIFHR